VFSPATGAVNDPNNSDANTTTGLTPSVVLSSGESNPNLDAGIYEPASLGDRVWVDANGNGIQDAGESGLANATVTLYNSSNAAIGNVTTDAGGNYSFAGLAPGTYSVGFTLPGGYVFTTQAGALSVADNSDADPSTGRTTTVVLSSGDAVPYMDAGAYLPASLGDFVWVDTNLNGLQDGGETGLAGVPVTLYNSANAAVGNTTTDGSGLYSFTGLAPGSYYVGFALPGGYAFTTANVGGNDALDSDANGLGLTPPVILTSGANDPTLDAGLVPLYSLSGTVFNDHNALDDLTVNGTPTNTGNPLYVNLLDGNGTVLAVATIGSNGTYFFGGLTSGNYSTQVTINAGTVGQPATVQQLPTGWFYTGDHVGAGPGDDGTPDGILNAPIANANVVEVNFGLRKLCEATWLDWQVKYGVILGNATAFFDNPDGDVYSNALEYAFCLPPDTGLQQQPPFCVSSNGSAVDAFMVQPCGIQDVTYTLFVIANLANAPAGWTEVTSILPVPAGCGVDGKQMVKWPGINSLPGLENGGFAIIRVEIDFDGDNVVDATDWTEVCGWTETVLTKSCQSYADPYLNHEIFTGVVDGVSGQTLDVTTSGNGVDFAVLLGDGREYYIEVLEGALEGHRYDVEEATSGLDAIVITPDTDIYKGPVYNTRNSTSGLAGNLIALRAHRTVADMFPPSLFFGSDDFESSDNVLIWSGANYNLIYLLNFSPNPNFWTMVTGSPTIENVNTLIVPSGMGMAVHRKEGSPAPALLTLRSIGGVRENNFAHPLPSGDYFTAAPYPVDQSAFGRGMINTNGFTGSGVSNASDRFNIWEADTVPGATGLITYRYAVTSVRNQWINSSGSLTDFSNALLFKKNRSALNKTINSVPSYIMPAPWSPTP